jgi:hypothetical protein
MTCHDIFDGLKIPVEAVNLGPADAFEKLKNREIAATVVTTGAPATVLKPLKASDGYRLIPVPPIGSLMEDYVPARLTNADYPDLIAPGEVIDTIAVSTVLIAYNWPKDTDRYRRIDKFVKAFFAKFDDFLKPPRSPKWREANLFATVKGWKRFDGAETALSDLREQMLAKERPQAPQAQQQTGAAAQANHALTDAERNQLFEDFLKWSNKR